MNNELAIKVRLTLMEDMLGTAPSNPEIYSSYISAKAKEDGKDVADEIKSIEKATEEADTLDHPALTVFHRDPVTGDPIIYDYLIKGMFKNACSALRDVPGSLSSKIKAYKKKIDGTIFVQERMIKIALPEGTSMGYCERPLRASTAQGERIALAASESIPAGSIMEFTIEPFTKEMHDLAIEWLNYGRYNGLGQWHNSGKGRFTWEEITE